MKTISLRDFLKSALLDLAGGITDANAALKAEGKCSLFIMNASMGDSHDKHKGIEFDIAITASEDKATSSGFGVALVSIGAGAKSENESAASVTHRMKFEVCTRHSIEE